MRPAVRLNVRCSVYRRLYVLCVWAVIGIRNIRMHLDILCLLPPYNSKHAMLTFRSWPESSLQVNRMESCNQRSISCHISSSSSSSSSLTLLVPLIVLLQSFPLEADAPTSYFRLYCCISVDSLTAADCLSCKCRCQPAADKLQPT